MIFYLFINLDIFQFISNEILTILYDLVDLFQVMKKF